MASSKPSNWKGLSTAALALALVAGAFCHGAESDPSRLPKENVALIGYAGAFRTVAATNFDATARHFDQKGKLKPLQDLPIQRFISDSWCHFFGGTFVLAGHLGSTRPVVVFYNPFFDDAVVTLWATDGKKTRPVLADAWVAANQTQTETTNQILSPFEAAQRLQQFEKSFGEKFPAESATPISTVPTEEQRQTALQSFTVKMMHWQLQLAELQKLDKTLKSPPWRTFLATVHAGNKAALEKHLHTNMTATAEAILVLPPYMRQSLQPGYTLVSSNAVLLFSWSRDFPRFALFSDYRREGEWRLNNAALLMTKP